MTFTILVLVTLGLFFIPAYVIRPFAYQSPRGLLLAMAVKQQAPWLALLTGGAALLMAGLLWRRVRILGRTLLVLGVCLACAAAVMTRVDYFEWMFHPVSAPGFAAIAQTQLEPSEMVMAVQFGSDARAYPIREMAYHHVVNDVVSGVPIAVTY